MKYLILLLTLFSFSAQSATNTVMLISPLVQMDERDLPKTLDKSYVSFSKYYLDSFPKTKNVENLLKEFENAQKYYLVKSNELARQYYEKVVNFSDVDEWKDVHRKIIYLSYLRLAELDLENQEDWILKALQFSLDTDPSKLNLSKDMLKKTLDLKKSFLKQTINWPVTSFKTDFSYILINGHVIDLQRIETIKIPSGRFRLTFLSDIYKTQTYQVTSQQIPLLTPTRIPFVSGSCEKPFVNNEGEIQSQMAVYYSRDCIKNFVGKKWIGSKNSKAAFTPEVETPRFTTRAEYNNEPFYKEKWFLVGAGILAASAAIYMVNESKKEKPTHETVNGF